SPFTVTRTGTNPFGCGTGWSGLRFDDLTTISTPCKNPGRGYLAVDTAGNVIYVDTAVGGSRNSPNGIGYCPSIGTGLQAMLGSGGYDMGVNGANFYFGGTYSRNITNTNVAIGN